jgi:capsular polysaccharide biosynthesis protein
VDPEAARSFSRLYFATPVNDHPVAKSPVALDHLGATLQHWSDGLHKEVLAARLRDLWRSGRPGLRLFVDRNPKRLRDLLNRNAIRTLLRRWGFRVLNTERMPFDKQVALFSNAGIVVGIMGAGMANTLFCRPGTPVVYLAPETWLEAFYWDLAATRGHPYHVLYGPTEAGERSEHLRDFTIDPAELDRVLAGIAGAPLR